MDLGCPLMAFKICFTGKFFIASINLTGPHPRLMTLLLGGALLLFLGLSLSEC